MQKLLKILSLLSVGIVSAYFWLRSISVWFFYSDISTTYFRESTLFFAPILALVMTGVWLLVYVILIFKLSSRGSGALVKWLIVFLGCSLTLCLLMYSDAGKLFKLTLFKNGEAPVSVFESLDKGGFKVLVPQEKLLDFEPSWQDNQPDSFSMTFTSPDATSLTVTQLQRTNSQKICPGLSPENHPNYSFKDILIGTESAEFYFEESGSEDSFWDHCVLTKNSIIHISTVKADIVQYPEWHPNSQKALEDVSQLELEKWLQSFK